MKICSKCKETKTRDSFHKDSRAKSGLSSRCKDCHMSCDKGSYSRNAQINNPSPWLVARRFYQRMVLRCKHSTKYGNVSVNLSLDELEDFVSKNWADYMNAHNEWEKSGFKMQKSPSLDRINPRENYENGNIRIVTLSDNVRYMQEGKITPENINKILEVRDDCVAGMKHTDIATKHGLSKQMVSAISCNRAYTNKVYYRGEAPKSKRKN